MKPIIIIKEKNKDGKFELTEQELKDLVEKAYEQGVEEGRPKATLPQSQYDRPEDGILYRNINGWTTSDPRDNKAILTITNESNDLVYRGGEHKVISPKQGEPIPCGTTTGQPNPTTKLNGLTVSTGV